MSGRGGTDGDDAVLDRAAFDDFAGLFDAAELRGIVDDWREDSERALAAIGAALAREDRAAIGELAHRAAGGGLALGALAFARGCEDVRARAEGGVALSQDDVERVRVVLGATHAAMTGAAAEQ